MFKKFKMTRQTTGIITLVVVALITGGIYFYLNYQIVKSETLADEVAAANTQKQMSFAGLTVIKKEKDLLPEVAAQKAIDFANKKMLEGTTATLESVKEENGLYTFKLKVDGQEYESYVTKNGKMFFVQGIKIEETPAETKLPEVTKSDRPDVKIFIMSYCPFGLQAEKMFLPAYDLLKDKTDMGIYFVNYAMHGKAEIDENLRQYCIQKDQKDKFAAYVQCFTADESYNSCTTTESKPCTGNFTKCLAEADINTAALDSCVKTTDQQFNVTVDYNDKSKWLNGQFPKFEVQSDLNEKYKVEGSPTVVINESIVNVDPRSPGTFKQIVCSAFNTQPEECSQTLSNDAPSTGFGTAAAASSDSSGGCGN